MTTAIKKQGPAKRAAARGKTAKATIQVRVDRKTKEKAARFFKRFGLSTSDGVRRLIDGAINDKDPWLAHEMTPHIPNAETREALLDEDLQEISLSDLRKMFLEDE